MDFEGKIGSDGRVYIPVKVGEQLGIEDGDIVKLEAEKDVRYSKVTIRRRKTRTEYSTNFDSQYSGEKININVEKLETEKLGSKFDKILQDFDWVIDCDKVIVLGRKSTIKLNKENLSLEKFTHYLGAFYADGDKKGPSWGISASTKEQLNYYLQKHKKLVLEADLQTALSYTYYGSEKEKNVRKYWRDLVKIDSVKSYESDVEKSKNRNEKGSIRIRTYKKVLNRLYNEMLQETISEIKKGNLSSLEFILGMLEGDGCPKGKDRGNITQTVEKNKKKEVKLIYEAADLQPTVYKQKDGNYTFILGSLDILSKPEIIKSKLFMYYPKRRQRFLKRLKKSAIVKRIVQGETILGSNSKKLKEKGVLDEDNELTQKGEKVKKTLESVK